MINKHHFLRTWDNKDFTITIAFNLLDYFPLDYRFLSVRHLYTGLVVGLTISSSRSLRFLPFFCFQQINIIQLLLIHCIASIHRSETKSTGEKKKILEVKLWHLPTPYNSYMWDFRDWGWRPLPSAISGC